MKKFYSVYFSEIKEVLNKIDLDSFHLVNKIMFDSLIKGKQVFTMGNGGSSSTASHFVGDLDKGVCVDGHQRFRALCLNDNIPTLMAYANDVSYSDVFCEQLKNFLNKGDIVIGFSGSGNSENIIKAIDYANDNGGITVGFSGFDGGLLAKKVQYPVVVPIDDMQKCEDVHLLLCHMMMQALIV